MKRILVAAVVALAGSTPLAFAADVGVSIGIGDPRFYGRIDIGGYEPPAVINDEPIVVERIPAYGPPVYLRVPPGHAKHWRKHCHEYHACGERAYFVRDGWYEHVYVPRYRERHHWDDEDDDD